MTLRVGSPDPGEPPSTATATNANREGVAIEFNAALRCLFIATPLHRKARATTSAGSRLSDCLQVTTNKGLVGAQSAMQLPHGLVCGEFDFESTKKTAFFVEKEAAPPPFFVAAPSDRSGKSGGRGFSLRSRR
jgi:hypothetical protein